MDNPGRALARRSRMTRARGRGIPLDNPHFWLLDTENGYTSGVDNLDPMLTINSITVAPTFRYKGGDADGTDWDAWTYGETLTAAGSGGSFNAGSPYLGTNDDSVDPAGTRYWQASGNSFADVTTEDMVFEAVFKSPLTGSQSIISKATTAGNQGWEVRTDTGNRISLHIDDGSSLVSVHSAGGSLVAGAWYLAQCYVDRSGSGQWYINGVASGSPVAVSSLGSLTTVDILTAAKGAGGIANQHIAYLAMWKQASWIDTHLQAAVAKERFARLCGLWPRRALGTKVWDTFTRATTAHVDKVEYGAELLPEPLDFSDAAWNKTRSSVTEATGVTTPGGVQAYNLHEDATAASTHWASDGISVTAGTIYELSFSIRPNNRTFAIVNIFDSASNFGSYFNLSTGTAGTAIGSPVDAGAEDEGNGWYRCWVRGLAGATGSGRAEIYVAEADNDANFDGLDQDSLYIANASVKTYERKLYLTGAGHPRMCYRQEDTSGADFKGYLPETAATNLCTHSAEFDNAAWTKTRSSVVADSVAAPDGTTTADTLHEDATAANTHYVSDGFTQAASTAYVASVWVKAENRTWVFLQITSPTDGAAYAYFDVSGGTVGTESGNDDADIEDWGNGWFRCWIRDTRTTAEAGASYTILVAEADNDPTFDGLDQDSLYLWGAQVEAGVDYPSSYIPTSGATATRNADVLYYTGDDGNVVNNQQGTMECDVLLPDVDNTATRYLVSMSDGGSLNESLLLRAEPTSDRAGFLTYTAGSPTAQIAGTTDVADGDSHTARGTWKVDSVNMYIDGTSEGTPDTSCAMPDDLDRAYVGTRFDGAGNEAGCLIRNVRIWPTPKTP